MAPPIELLELRRPIYNFELIPTANHLSFGSYFCDRLRGS
jgi:hypothetical protein